jgi:ribosomal protein S18 acetylase RimI-like enzyme
VIRGLSNLTGNSDSPPAVSLRPFTPADQAAARQLILSGLGEHFGYIDETKNPDVDDIKAHYLEQGHLFVVAESGAALAGTGALITEAAEIGRIVRMSVARQYRRQGIGRMIVAHLIEMARQRGLRKILVETNLDWDDAIGLYKRCGFSEYGRDDESVHLCLEL